MKKKIAILIWSATLTLTGCNIPLGGPAATATISALDPTVIVETVYAQLTANAPATPTVSLNTPTPAASPTPNFTATPSLSPTVTLTPTPSTPMIAANLNTNCRMGPGIVYPVVGYLLVGQSVQVMGRLSDNSWWVIQHPTRAGQVCWVWARTTMVSGDLGLLPVATPPPTPTPTNTATATRTPTITITVTPTTPSP